METTPRHQDSELEKSHKQKEWEKQIAFLREIEEDPSMDENIIETIAALNLNGIHTVASCGGHAVQERHTGDSPFPWVLIAPSSEQEDQSPEAQQDRDREKCIELKANLEALLAEFYKDRQVEEDDKLRIGDEEPDQFSLSSLIDTNFNTRLADGELTEEEKKDLVGKLPKRQQEMKDFGQFLKSKFLGG